jgi:HupE/UreJ protein
VARPRVSAAVFALVALLSAPLTAHEIPRDVTVHAFVKPEGQQLRVLLRVPLAAMRDIQFPERDGFLDIQRAEPDLLDGVVRWLLPTLTILENGVPMTAATVAATRVSLPSDRSFGSYAEALAHVSAPSDPDLKLPWNQAMLDVLVEYPIRSDRSRFAIRPGFERLGVQVLTVVRLVTPDGNVRAFELRGDPGLVQLDPRWHQAALHFVKLGFTHILDGTDHLLFLACLVIPFRRLRPLILVVTAFTVAHSVTLIASALGVAPGALWFPPLIETLIAASIVFLALENIVRGASTTARWAMALGFGLVHGFGFSFALRETLQFAGTHLLTSLLSFNIGVELGQVLVLVVLVPALNLFFRYVVAERIGIIVLSAIVAHTAWHWMTERWDALSQFPSPSIDALVVVRTLLVIVGIAAVVWLVRGWIPLGDRRRRSEAL